MRYLNMKIPEGYMRVSKIVLGTDYFGTTVSEDEAFKMLDTFADAGGNCLDTARMYAQWLPGGKGASELLLGRWLKSRGNRNKIIISTKGAHPEQGHMDVSRLSRREIETDLDESLKALNTDTIDIYWLHRDDVNYPVEDIMETLSLLIKKGKVRSVGCSNWGTERIREANQAALKNGLTPFSVSQIQWSLAASTPEAHDDPTIVCMNEKEYDWYLKQQFPVFAYSSQAKGFFARAAVHGLDILNEKAKKRFATPENIERLERVKEYVSQSGLTPTAVSLGYLLCNKVPAVAVVGCKRLEQLQDSLTAADAELDDVTVEWLFKG